MNGDGQMSDEWYAPGILKPPMAIEFAETKAWRQQQIDNGARVLTPEEWKEITHV